MCGQKYALFGKSAYLSLVTPVFEAWAGVWDGSSTQKYAFGNTSEPGVYPLAGRDGLAEGIFLIYSEQDSNFRRYLEFILQWRRSYLFAAQVAALS